MVRLAGWARCSTTELALSPPNQRLFLNHNPEVTKLLKTGADSSGQSELAGGCSDFDAAKVLGRTDDKVGWLGRRGRGMHQWRINKKQACTVVGATPPVLHCNRGMLCSAALHCFMQA